MYMGPTQHDGEGERSSSAEGQYAQGPWRPIMVEGPLIFAQSPREYAVYDGNHVYGRWPLAPEYYAQALNMFQAYRQSYLSGLAYTATGRLGPRAVGLPSTPYLESKSYAAPLSFVGSTRRVIAWTKGVTERNPAMGVPAWIAGGIFLVMAWWFILLWYFVIFGIFGIFVIPFRLVRRSQRKALHVQETALATQQAMFAHMAYMQGGRWHARPGPPFPAPWMGPEPPGGSGSFPGQGPGSPW